MNEYVAEWSGYYPFLCSGEWTLYKNGELLDVDIPFQNEPANTYGTYESWYFDESWLEQFEYYEDGMNAEEWIDEYKEWLESFAPEEDWAKIYEAFQLDDWRYVSCGGCI